MNTSDVKDKAELQVSTEKQPLTEFQGTRAEVMDVIFEEIARQGAHPSEIEIHNSSMRDASIVICPRLGFGFEVYPVTGMILSDVYIARPFKCKAGLSFRALVAQSRKQSLRKVFRATKDNK